MPSKDLPGTIQRSPKKAQRTFESTLESAHEQYDDGVDVEGHTKKELLERAKKRQD